MYIQFVFNVHKSGSDQPSWDICTPAKGSCCAACGHLWTVKYDFWTKALLQTEHWCGRRFVCSIISLARTPLATKKANLCQHFLCVEFLPLQIANLLTWQAQWLAHLIGLSNNLNLRCSGVSSAGGAAVHPVKPLPSSSSPGQAGALRVGGSHWRCPPHLLCTLYSPVLYFEYCKTLYSYIIRLHYTVTLYSYIIQLHYTGSHV